MLPLLLPPGITNDLQTSNSVSVIDPSSNKLLGVISLGGKLSDSLSAVYRGQSLVHGMGFSPDHRTVAIVCVGSNALVFIDTNTNTVKAVTYVGRAPHEAFWTPNGKEVWVAIRGQDYIQVLDGSTYQPTRQIQVSASKAALQGLVRLVAACSLQLKF